MVANSQKQLAESASDPRWESVRTRDARADGTFFYAVHTTGVYCRPSCAARLPRRENVAFFTSERAAEQAGFRPCMRCKPNLPPLASRQAAQVAALCRFIEQSDQLPRLELLAQRAGLSVFYTQRLFKRVTGLTPRAYAAAQRAERVRSELGKRGSVTEAIYGAGFNSSGRFYEKAGELLGMTASEYRAGGDGQTIRFAIGVCSLGSLLVAATARGVCAILLGDEGESLRRDLERRFPRAQLLAAEPAFEALVARVVNLIERPECAAELPLDLRGTTFQRRVWKALSEIPRGETKTYAEIAQAVGVPGAVRAVAQACSANPVAVAIPCHRVVRKDGELAGYRWGVERKRELLARERGGRAR